MYLSGIFPWGFIHLVPAHFSSPFMPTCGLIFPLVLEALHSVFSFCGSLPFCTLLACYSSSSFLKLFSLTLAQQGAWGCGQGVLPSSAPPLLTTAPVVEHGPRPAAGQARLQTRVLSRRSPVVPRGGAGTGLPESGHKPARPWQVVLVLAPMLCDGPPRP